MFDQVVVLVERGGYVGIALLMLAENLFPPIPSELIMPLAGFSAAQGRLNVVLVAPVRHGRLRAGSAGLVLPGAMARAGPAAAITPTFRMLAAVAASCAARSPFR